MPALRIFFASDVHGSELCFRKFVGAASFYQADVIIMGGDITGKAISPIFEGSDGAWRAKFLGEDVEAHTGEQLERLTKRMRDLGYYPYRTTKEKWESLLSNREQMDKLFEQLVTNSLQDWFNYASEKLAGADVQCYVSPGNDDTYFVDEILKRAGKVINPNEQVISVAEGIQMVSLGYSNPTPWQCPRDIPDEEIGRKIEALVTQADSNSHLVFNIHVPPFGSGIDMAPELDGEMRPKLGPGGQVRTVPVGSTTTRNAIEKYKPVLGLHGHVHEGRGFAKIGPTLCLNPGSEYQEGVLRGVLIQLRDGKVKDFLFTAG